MKLRERANRLRSDLPAVFLALRDRDTPLIAKILAGITVGYALSPLDLIPDFVPVLGYLDDVILLPLLVALTVRCIPAPVWEKSRESAAGLWKDGKPRRWYYAIPVVAIWALLLALLARALWR